MEMWDKIKEFAKEHPYALGAIIFIVGAILVYLIFHRSSSGATSTTDPNAAYYSADAAAIQSGNQLYEQQMQLQAASQANQDQLAATTANYATQEQIAQLNANVATQQIQAQQESTDLASTLGAKLSSQQIAASLQMNENNNATNVTLNNDNNGTALAELNSQLSAQVTEQQAQAVASQNALQLTDLTNLTSQAMSAAEVTNVIGALTGQGAAVASIEPSSINAIAGFSQDNPVHS